MSRVDRLIVIVSFLLTAVVLLALVGVLGSIGPLELLVVLIVAVPVSFLISRVIRSVVSGGASRPSDA